MTGWPWRPARAGSILCRASVESGGAPRREPDSLQGVGRLRGYSEKKSDFQAAFALLHSGRFPAERIITHRLPLERISEAFPLMERGEALKVCILPQS